LPYRATDWIARPFAVRQGLVSLPTLRLMSGAVAFLLWWGALTVAVVLVSESIPVTLSFLAAMAGAAFFGLYYADRMRAWWEELRALLLATRPGVRRITRARQDLLVLMTVLLARFQTETGTVLVPPARRSPLRRLPWRLFAVIAVLLAAAWLLWRVLQV
ncbi:MAG: hypothetical protein ABFS86_17600, partial [Planctomycetota bacterium]